MLLSSLLQKFQTGVDHIEFEAGTERVTKTVLELLRLLFLFFDSDYSTVAK
jgi:hypothetical protein